MRGSRGVGTNYIVKVGGEALKQFATLVEARKFANKWLIANEVQKINQVVEIYKQRVVEKQLKVMNPDLTATGNFNDVFGGV